MFASYSSTLTRFLGSALLLTTLFILQGCGGEKETPETSGPTSKIEIIAHRGDSHAKPENTMAAVHSAWQKEANAVEIDVYLTTDKKIVAIHDKTTKRTGDKNLSVTKSSAQELRTVDVGYFKGEEFAGEKIPFLKEIVDSVPSNKRLFIEIKDSDRIVPYVKDIIEQSGKKEQMVIISFSLDVVKASKKQMPDIPVYWLRSVRRDAETGKYQTINTALLDTVREYGLDGLDVHFQGVTPELVKASHKAGYGLYVWTVDGKEELERMRELGVDGVTTNRVSHAQDILR